MPLGIALDFINAIGPVKRFDIDLEQLADAVADILQQRQAKSRPPKGKPITRVIRFPETNVPPPTHQMASAAEDKVDTSQEKPELKKQPSHKEFKKPSEKEFQRQSSEKEFQRQSSEKEFNRQSSHIKKSGEKEFQRQSSEKEFQRQPSDKDLKTSEKEFQRQSSDKDLKTSEKEFQRQSSDKHLKKTSEIKREPSFEALIESDPEPFVQKPFDREPTKVEEFKFQPPIYKINRAKKQSKLRMVYSISDGDKKFSAPKIVNPFAKIERK